MIFQSGIPAFVFKRICINGEWYLIREPTPYGNRQKEFEEMKRIMEENISDVQKEE